MDRNRLAAFVAFPEIVALEHAGHRVVRRKLDETGGVHVAHPGRVEFDAGPVLVQDLVDLGLVGLRVLPDLPGGQRRTRRILARRITNHSREIADQEYDLVAVLLELPHLVDQHRVPDMQVGRRRVEAGLDNERPVFPELGRQSVLGQHLVGAAGQLRDLFLDVAHYCLSVTAIGVQRNCSILGR